MWHTRINFRFLFADFHGFSNGAYRVAVSFKGFGAFNVRNVAAAVAQWRDRYQNLPHKCIFVTISVRVNDYLCWFIILLGLS